MCIYIYILSSISPLKNIATSLYTSHYENTSSFNLATYLNIYVRIYSEHMPCKAMVGITRSSIIINIHTVPCATRILQLSHTSTNRGYLASHWEARVPGDIFVPAPLHPLAVGIVQSTLELLEHKLTSFHQLPAFLVFGMRGNTKLWPLPHSFGLREYEGFQNPSSNVRKTCLEFIFGDKISISREDCLVSFTGLGHFPLKPWFYSMNQYDSVSALRTKKPASFVSVNDRRIAPAGRNILSSPTSKVVEKQKKK